MDSVLYIKVFSKLCNGYDFGAWLVEYGAQQLNFSARFGTAHRDEALHFFNSANLVPIVFIRASVSH